MAGRGRSRAKQPTVTPELKSVMLLCGPERALVDQAIAHVRAQTLDGGMADFNHDRLQGKQCSVEQVLACARTLPVMAPRRLVELREAEALGAEGLQKIASYAEAPVQEAVLLLVAADVDRRTRAAKAFDRLGCLFRYDHLDESGLAKYTQQRAKNFGLRLDREAADLLVQAVGTELQLVERALEKLDLVCDGEVTVEQIEAHISQTRVESIFSLTDAIARGDRGEALLVLGQMLDAREAPLRILATLIWQQRQLLRARALLDQGVPSGQMLRAVKVFRNGDRFARRVRAMPITDVKQGLRVLAQADRLLKSSRGRPRMILERAILQLAGLRAA